MTREQQLSRVFVELADTLVADYDVMDLLHTLAERSIELLHADAAGIILKDADGRLEVVASTSHEAETVELFVVQNSEGPCLDCVLTGEQLMNIDLTDTASQWPGFVAKAASVGFRSTHAIPLRHRDQVIGAMNLFGVGMTPLDEGDVTLGQGLADFATIALLQKRALRHQEVLSEQLQTALNSRITVEQAKGALAERAGIEVEEAFAIMRTYCRRSNQRLTVVAASVLDGSLTADDLRAR